MALSRIRHAKTWTVTSIASSEGLAWRVTGDSTKADTGLLPCALRSAGVRGRVQSAPEPRERPEPGREHAVRPRPRPDEVIEFPYVVRVDRRLEADRHPGPQLQPVTNLPGRRIVGFPHGRGIVGADE